MNSPTGSLNPGCVPLGYVVIQSLKPDATGLGETRMGVSMPRRIRVSTAQRDGLSRAATPLGVNSSPLCLSPSGLSGARRGRYWLRHPLAEEDSCKGRSVDRWETRPGVN